MQQNMGPALLLTTLKNSNETLFICAAAKKYQSECELPVNLAQAEMCLCVCSGPEASV